MHYYGAFIIYGNTTKGTINSLKNIFVLDKRNSKFKAVNETGLYIEEDVPNLSSQEYLDKNRINCFSGDANTGFVDYILFNFDMELFNRRINYNTIKDAVTAYLRKTNSSSPVLSNFLHKDLSVLVLEEYKPRFSNVTQGEDGYWFGTFDTDVRFELGHVVQGEELNKSYSVTVDFEVISGSILFQGISHMNREDNSPSLYKNGELVNRGEPLPEGVYRLDFFVYQNNGAYYFGVFKSLSSDTKVKAKRITLRPLAAIMRFRGDKSVNGKIVDDVAKVTRCLYDGNVQVSIIHDNIPLTSPTYSDKAPNRAPLFIGEEWIDTSTGDVYKAGNLTAFKKITNV